MTMVQQTCEKCGKPFKDDWIDGMPAWCVECAIREMEPDWMRVLSFGDYELFADNTIYPTRNQCRVDECVVQRTMLEGAG